MRYIRLVLIAILIALAAWKLYPHLGDLSKIYELRHKINYFYLIIGILFQSGQWIGDGLLSQTLLKIINIEMSFKNSFKIASLNVLAAHLFPVGEAGSIATAYFFYKKLGVPTQSFIFLSVCWSAITFAVLIFIFTASIFFLPHLPSINFKLVGIVLLAALILVPSILFALRKLIWHKFRARLINLSFFKELSEFKANLHQYRKALLSHKLLLLQAALAAFIYYGTNVLTLSFSFLTFGSLPPISLVAFAYALSMIGGWITLSPAGIGASEATLILVFLQFNQDPTVAVGAVLVFRLISFWIPIPAGLVSYLSLKRHFANPNEV